MVFIESAVSICSAAFCDNDGTEAGGGAAAGSKCAGGFRFYQYCCRYIFRKTAAAFYLSAASLYCSGDGIPAFVRGCDGICSQENEDTAGK